MNLTTFIDQTEYGLIAKSNWPTFDELVIGKPIGDPAVKKEIQQYVDHRQKKYWAIRQGDTIADQGRAVQQQVFFDKKVKGTSSRCNNPWDTLGINSYGDVFVCGCSAWVPKFVGNILQATDIYRDVLNSESAQKIRQEILEGRYYYCNHKICNYFKKLPTSQYSNAPSEIQDLAESQQSPLPQASVNKIPRYIVFDFDHTCNFVCPSCRTHLINHNKHSVISEVNKNIADKIKTLIIDNIDQQPVEIRWAGGEPFISNVYTDLMSYIIDKGKSNITHVIQTNGSYLGNKKNIVDSLAPHISELRISFDAATKETYQKVRINGQWDTLITNAKQMVELQRQTGYPKQITADFVVQLDNYQEIYKFYELCKTIGIKYINFQRMWNWNTWGPDTFANNNVYTESHPLYADVVKLLNQVKKSQNENTAR